MADEEKVNIHKLSRPAVQNEPELKPIVLKYTKLKKKKDVVEDDGKEKYSKGLKDIQRLEGNVVRITQKTTRALSKGMDVYERERERSAKEKTDGAIEDFIHNSAKAVSTSLKEASDIPLDVAESVSTNAYRKRLRKGLRRASDFLRLWRI